ncbi:MAG: hypothetical protein KIT56_09625 [Gammaproteobacteria bacterium]|nr:hypothetical protein [Gammaproteobacteria bacterium]MCW5584112.1 hypothetical protein [Gammaproteobacteria bacterium]
MIAEAPSKQVENQLVKRLLHACVREQLLPYTIKDTLLIIDLKQGKKTLIASKVQQFHLGKLKIEGQVMVIVQDQLHVVSTVDHLLELIYHEISNDVHLPQWEKFVVEVNNCNINKNLVAKFSEHFNHQLARKMVQSHAETLIQYITSCYSAAEQLMFFEMWAAKGHPYHPCHKTKLGFNSKAYQTFSPEFNQDIYLPLAAIAKSIIHVELGLNIIDYNDWFASQFPDAWCAWEEKICANGLSSHHYSPIFIHPWQYENVIIKLFQDIIEERQLLFFKDVYVTTKASLSFRTMIVKDSIGQPHIKLPIAVHSTSAMRTISPASVHNGPKLEKILKQILAWENHFTGHLKIAYEVCGLHVQFSNPEIEKHLGVIYRDNPANFLQRHEVPIVVAALFEKSPLNHIPLFLEIMQAAVGSSLQGAIQYFNQYCQVVVLAYLDLFLIYGVALEGHQQNTIAVFKNLYPAYMIARDLGGLRVHVPTLYSQGLMLEAYPNSATFTEESQEATNKFLHTVIQYHLGEIVLLLAQEYGVTESVFWKIVKANLVERFHTLKSRVPLDRWEREYRVIMEDDWQVKGLMRMRLHDVYNKYIYINLENPLRDIQ